MPEPGVFSRTDVALANRNKGMPLEALRHDITPVGMHYLLTHFDIPDLDDRDYGLAIDGLVETPQRLTLEGLQALDHTTRAVTMECAGNGRAELDPRPVNMPWGVEAVGTAEWTGVPLREVIDRAGIRDAAIELVFSGADEGIHRVE